MIQNLDGRGRKRCWVSGLAYISERIHIADNGIGLSDQQIEEKLTGMVKESS